MPTLLGVIFLCCSAYCFLTNKRGLFGVLIVATVFQASGALKFGDRGIQCAYIVESFIITRALLDRLVQGQTRKPMPQGRWLLLFLGIAVVSAFTLPFVFAGIPVYEPLSGIDLGLLVRPPLHFALNNVTQVCFLLWHVATAYAVLDIGFSAKSIRRAYLVAFYIVLFCVFSQAICRVTGIPFPDTWVRNNPDIWDLTVAPSVTRKPGTFIEPSFAGGFFVLYCSGFMAEYLAGRGNAKRLVLALLGCAMVTSSGSLFTLFLVFLMLIWAYPPFRFPWYFNVRRVKRLAWIGFVLLVPVLLAFFASGDLRASLLEQTVAKGDTGSFFNRTMSDVYGLELFIRTYGLGVGLGSSRSSSLVTTLLSTVGAAGAITFGAFCIPLFRSLDGENFWLKWAGFGMLLNMIIDIPDVTLPIVWVTIMLAIAANVGERQRYKVRRVNDSAAKTELQLT